MKIHVLYFAVVRERLASDGEDIELEDGACVRDAMDALAARHATIADFRKHLQVALNQESARPDQALSDGDEVPGNHLLTASEKQRRAEAIYWPYHQAIASQVDRLRREDFAPALLSIHSFTPFFDNSHRPWEIGVLWDNDPRIAVPLMENLRDKGLNVGDNEPYSGRHPHDFTIDYHGEKRGLPHASIEIRQDLLHDTTTRRQWATTLADCLRPILEQEELYRFFHGQESAR